MKNRKIKEKEYAEKYKDIPLDAADRLSWMVDHYNLSGAKMNEILMKRDNMLYNLSTFTCKVVQLLEEPEGASRPRFTLLNKSNYNRAALNSSLVRVYVPNAKDDHNFMKKLTDQELIELDGLIATPCIIEYDAYYKTPSSFNTTDIFLSEIGVIRPSIEKPDWDNIGKKYCDMYNHNIWLDDSQVISGTVNKYYSILPRIEIRLMYLNALYNKSIYNRISSRKDFDQAQQVSYLNNKGEIVNG